MFLSRSPRRGMLWELFIVQIEPLPLTGESSILQGESWTMHSESLPRSNGAFPRTRESSTLSRESLILTNGILTHSREEFFRSNEHADQRVGRAHGRAALHDLQQHVPEADYTAAPQIAQTRVLCTTKARFLRTPRKFSDGQRRPRGATPPLVAATGRAVPSVVKKQPAATENPACDRFGGWFVVSSGVAVRLRAPVVHR
jgi:hypothetical protein